MSFLSNIISRTISLKQLTFIMLFILFSLIMVGCAGPTYNVTLDMDPTYHTANGVFPSVEVDIVAANDNEALRISAYPTDTYFQPENKFRKNLIKYTMFFSEEDFNAQTFKGGNALWSKWNDKGVTTLFIIANLPGVWEVKSGVLDPRKLKLPLSEDRWPSSWWKFWPHAGDIKVKMQSSGLFLQTPLTPIGGDK